MRSRGRRLLSLMLGLALCAGACAAPPPAISPAAIDAPLPRRVDSPSTSTFALAASPAGKVPQLAGSLAAAQPVAPEPDTAEPPRLIVERLNLDQAIVDVPLVDGAWTLDALAGQIGRLATTGAGPGAGLAPVLVGHVSMRGGAPGPFGDLWRLRVDDPIAVVWDGQTYEYRVASKGSLEPGDVRAIYQAGGDRLLLLTCDAWDFAAWDYTQRLLIQAELRVAPPAGE